MPLPYVNLTFFNQLLRVSITASTPLNDLLKNLKLKNYTQNIDTLETLAGVSRVLQCHGSFATASCIKCDLQVPGSEIEQDIQNQTVPYCQVCKETYSKPAPPRPPKKSKKGKKKGGWDSDESDESDEEPPTPPGIMKASRVVCPYTLWTQ